MGNSLTGKVAVVTGAAGGIGSAIARRFALDGATVISVDRDAVLLTEQAHADRQAGPKCRAVVADLADSEGHEAVAQAVRQLGRLDVYVANAAVQVMGDVERTSPTDWDHMYQTNVRGVMLGVRSVLPHLRTSGGGSLILTASILGIVGDPDLAAYGATKGALRSLCRSLASRHGPENIRCNTICPGDVQTKLVDEYFGFQQDPAAARQAVIERYPLRRFATPADVANVAAFLAADESSYLNGIDIPVDGGLLARVY
jgi:NAD(P)-dependent dehydrogenase (short-subunit alcohol dehydrogenase family)